MHRVAAAAALAAGAVLLGALPAAAAPSPVEPAAAAAPRLGVEDFEFASFSGEYRLGRDSAGHSTLAATETFVADFPEYDQNRGIVRMMPRGYLGVNLQTRIESVTDAEGAPVPYEVDTSESDKIILALGGDDYVHGLQTYRISYTQADVTRYFDNTDTDEFYRDSIGVQLRQDVRDARMSIIVEPELIPALNGEAACYRGVQNSRDRCEFSREDGPEGAVFASDPQVLTPGQNITMAVGFRPETFTRGEVAAERPVFTWLPAGIAGTGVLAVVGASIARRRPTRDLVGDGIVVAQYSPPPGVDLAVSAQLIGASTRFPQAGMIDLAVRGNIRIVDISTKPGKNKFELEYLHDRGVDAPLAALLRGLFGKNAAPGKRRAIKEPSKRLTQAVEKIAANARSDAREQGLTVRVGLPRAGLWILLGLALTVGSVIVMMRASGEMAGNGWVYGGLLLTILTLVIIAVLAVPRDVLTVEGHRTREYLEGVKLYLSVAESERLRILQSPAGAERIEVAGPIDPVRVLHLYESLLPLAVLWRVEKQWGGVLAQYYVTESVEPYWYGGNSAFNAAVFGATLGSFGTSATSAASWSPPSSSSGGGGAGGGGFSGGGSGGGGVGGR